MQGLVSGPPTNVLPVGGDEGVTLVRLEPEASCLEGWDEVDFPRAVAHGVPVGEYDPVFVAEEVSPVGIAVDHPCRKSEREAVVGVLELFAAITEPDALSFTDRVTGFDRLMHGC